MFQPIAKLLDDLSENQSNCSKTVNYTTELSTVIRRLPSVSGFRPTSSWSTKSVLSSHNQRGKRDCQLYKG